MKCSIFIGILIICTPLLVLSEQQHVDSVASQVVPTEIVKTNPLLIVGASGIVPGAGQFYSQHYLKGATFLALEAGIASVALFWNQTAKVRGEEFHTRLLSVSSSDSGIVLAEKLERAYEKKYDALGAEFKRYNALTWMAGIYAYNLMDAFESTGLVRNTGQRVPGVAFRLSLIPALGLGQIYNGSYSKSGLVLMTQVSLGVLAWNYHRLMKQAESNYGRVSDTLVTLPAIKNNYADDWDGKRRTALRNRNMYLWYSIAAYVVGMLDAVVDAHLHDYQERMRIEPDLVPYDDGVGINLSVKF